MSNYNNVNRVLIGKGTNDAPITHVSGIKKGDLFFIDEKNNVIANATAAAALANFEKITLAVGIAAGEAVLSSPIQGNTVSKYEGVKHVPSEEMAVILGFNGTAGTGIEVSAETEYRLRVLIKDDNRVHGQRPTLFDVNASTGVAGDVEELLYKVACTYYQKDYGHSAIGDKVELVRVSNGTFAALTNDASVIKGSDIVTSTSHGVSVGDYVRLGGTSDQSPVYKVKELVDADNFKIDTPYQGVTEVITNTNVGKITDADEFGIKLSGISQDSFLNRGENEPVDEYEWILFDAAFTTADTAADSSSASVYKAEYTELTQLNPGQGVWKQVADVEEKAKGYLGDTSKRRFFDKRIDSNTVVGTGYDSIIITHTDVHGGNFQDTYSAPLKTEIYIPTGGAGQGDESTATSFLAILNGFFGTKLGFPLIDFS